VIALTFCSAAIAVIVFYRPVSTLDPCGAVLESLISVVAGLCVLQLRRRKPDAPRLFRIKDGKSIPLLTVAVFGLLGIAAALAPDTPGLMMSMPMLVTLTLFLCSTLSVVLVIPRLHAAAAKKRATMKKRHPGKAMKQEGKQS